MKPAPILSLATMLLLSACAGEAQRGLVGPAQVQPQPLSAAASQPGHDNAWANAVASAKVAGSLYRIGAFFPDVTAAAEAAVALP
jgi:hypothetical protein